MTSHQYSGILKGETFNFIAVDNFTTCVVRNASVFFLTHYHSDHYKGLWDTDSAKYIGQIFKENPDKLFYCSPITKQIFESNRDINCFIPEEQIISHPIGRPFSICGPKRKDKEQVIVTVTFVPSGHILGAVMILFEHEMERALFTGDFRIHPSDVAKVKALHDCDGNVKTISHLYLDTTFASVKYPSFPLRSEISKFVADIILQWLPRDKRNVVHLNLPYDFAYEQLASDISRKLKYKVMVNRRKYKNYYWHIPELHAAFCSGSENFERNHSPIHACKSPGSFKRTDILSSCEFCPFDKRYVLLIRPCARFFTCDIKDYKSYYNECDKSDIIRVPYSSHCSLEELQAFVNYIRPTEITTILTKDKDLENFKNNILPLIERTKISEEDMPCDEVPKNSPPLIDLTDSDYCDSDFDLSGLESPPR